MKFTSKIKILVTTLLLALSALSFTACSVTPNDYVDNSRNISYNTYKEIVIDGKIDDAAWANKNKFVIDCSIGGTVHHVEASATFAEEGVVIYWSVKGAPAYYNVGRSKYDNSSIEMYLCSGNAYSAQDRALQIQLSPMDVYGVDKYIKPGANNGYSYSQYAAYVDMQGEVDGKINDASNNGYTIECMVPWYALGESSAPEYVCINAAIIYCTDEISQREAWFSIAESDRRDYGWTNSQGWYKFNNDGYLVDNDYKTWAVSSVAKNIETSGENGRDVKILSSWNTTTVVEAKDYITGDSYQEITIFKPSLANPDHAEQEADVAEETATGGLAILRKGADRRSKGVEIVGHYEYGKWRYRFQSASYSGYEMTEAQLAKFSDPEQGLRIGMLVIDNMVYGYVENDYGEMVMFGQCSMANRDNSFNSECTKIVGIQSHTSGIYKNYKLCYGDDLATVPHVINGGETVVGGSVELTGHITEGFFVEVYPDNGYDLKSLKINGKDIEVASGGIYVQFDALETPFVDIDVEFEASTVEKYEVTLSIMGGYNYDKKPLVDSLVLFNSENGGLARTDAEGNLTVNLSAGDYIVNVPGYEAKTFTVSGDVDGQTLSLTKLMFNESEYWTVDNSGDNGYSVTSMVDDNDRVKITRFADVNFNGEHKDGIAVSFTYKAIIKDGSKYFPTLLLLGETDSKRATLQFAHWGAKVDFKYYERELVKNIKSGAGTIEMDFLLVVTGSKFSIYKFDNDEYVPLFDGSVFVDVGFTVKSLNVNYCNDYAAGTEATWEEWSFNNVKLVELESAPVTAEANDYADVVVDRTEVKFGQSIKISATPKEAEGDNKNIITAVKVNNKAIDYIVNDEGVVEATYTISDLTPVGYEITVEAGPASLKTINLTAKTGVPYNNDLSLLAKDTVVTFTGSMYAQATVGDNGLLSVELSNGQYRVLADGCATVTLVVDDSVTNGSSLEIILAKSIMDVTDTKMGAEVKKAFTTSAWSEEKGYYVSSTVTDAYIGLASDINVANGVEFKFRYKTTGIDGTSQFYPNFSITGVDDAGATTRLEAQLCTWNGTTYIKQPCLNKEDKVLATSDIDQVLTFKICKKDGKFVVEIYKDNQIFHTVTLANTSVVSNNSVTDPHYISTITEIGIYYNFHNVENLTWEISEIEITPIPA